MPLMFVLTYTTRKKEKSAAAQVWSYVNNRTLVNHLGILFLT